ncbi:hypothetical protein ACIBEJ_18625 [Nonomuraea sp. NPDC050790]|uniref:hypothetical protein n=1 Tax=Nonomuraea sp. NPDC050790 TaxID=3364371 RepID=UPI00379F2012
MPVLVVAPGLRVEMARMKEINISDSVLAGLGFWVVFLLAGYALIALAHISPSTGKVAQKGRNHHAGKDDRIPGSP